MCPAVQEISDNKPVPLCSPRLSFCCFSFAIPRAARNSFVFPFRIAGVSFGSFGLPKHTKGKREGIRDRIATCSAKFPPSDANTPHHSNKPPISTKKKKDSQAVFFFSWFPGSASAGIHGRGANLLFFVLAEETRLASPHIYCARRRRAGDGVRLISSCWGWHDPSTTSCRCRASHLRPHVFPMSRTNFTGDGKDGNRMEACMVPASARELAVFHLI